MFENRHTLSTPIRILLATLTASIALLASSSGPPKADAATKSACARYGDRVPWKLGEQKAQRAVRCLINRQRRRHGLAKVQMDNRLENSSTNHTAHMRSTGCFAHDCPGEPVTQQRLFNVGYLTSSGTWGWGENIAYGNGTGGTPRSMVAAWMRSAPHRAAILNGAFRDIGIGFRSGTPGHAGAHGGIYTADFGYRR